jgi:drug/metabolite transporter (DMT)-like permease
MIHPTGPVSASFMGRRAADPLTYVLLVTANLIWGAAYLVITVALESFTPLALTTLRLILSTACLWLYARWSGETLAVPRRDVLPLLGIGFLLNTAFQICLNASLVFTTPAHASLGVSAMPIFAAVSARVLLRERLTARRTAAILMAFVGVALVIASGRGLAGGRDPVLGDLLALGTAASWALGSVLSKPFLLRYTPLKFTALTLVGGALSAIPWGAADLLRASWGAITAASWLALVYLSVFGMAVAMILWNRAIARIEVGQVAIFSNLTPVATLALSALLLGEPITLPLLAGGALVVGGAYLTQRT